jgi:hypothetical protein
MDPRVTIHASGCPVVAAMCSKSVDVLFDTDNPSYPSYRGERERAGWSADTFHQPAWPIWRRPDGDGLPLTYWLRGTRELAFGDAEGVTVAARRSYTHSPEWCMRDFERVIAAAEERASQA